jgi:hypothetical protein
MLRRLAAGLTLAVTLSIAASSATLVVAPASVLAASACSGWDSESIPPDTIRVYRTMGPDAGQVQVVPFRRYVEVVMAAEFGPGVPVEALRAGAIAAKQYAWYHAMHWRGRSNASGECYDVVDNGNDQFYLPLSKQPVPSHVDAIAHTWSISVRKGMRFFATGYWGGLDAPCGTVGNGWRLMQKSSYDCAKDGMTAEQILRVFYGPKLSIVRPGANDMNGDLLGDLGILLPGASTSDQATIPIWPGAVPDLAVAARVYDHAVAPADGGGSGTLRDTPVAQAMPVDRATGDVNGDGLVDLVFLRRDPTSGGLQVQVALAAAAAPSGDPATGQPVSTGATFLPAMTWWDASEAGMDLAVGTTTRIVAADFTGDGLADIGLLTDAAVVPPGDSAPLGSTSVLILPSTGSGTGPVFRAWSGQLPISGATARTGDVDGDGRPDLLVALPAAVAPGADPMATGTAIVALLGRSGSLGEPTTWAHLPDVEPTAAILAGDVDRDGRDDVVVIAPNGPSGVTMTGLLSDGTSFDRSTLRSVDTGYRPWAAKYSSADVNGDGRMDVIALYDQGVNGTAILTFISNGKKLGSGPRSTDRTLAWATAEPF